MNNVKRNTMLNLLKGFACIAVILIHVPFPSMVGQIAKWASAFAVPIFFMTAGYYAFGKNGNTIKRRLGKVAKIFIFAYFVFFVYRITLTIKSDEIMGWLENNYTIESLAKYILFCSIGFAIPLWYLLAQIETYVFWFFIVKIKKEDIVVKCLPILFILQVMLTSFCETMELDWFWKINFVTRSLNWFTLGYYLHTISKEKIRRISNIKLVTCALFGLTIVLIPIVFQLKIKFSALGELPYALALFVMALKYADKSICKPLEFLGDKLSLWVYIFHVPLAVLIKRVIASWSDIDVTSNHYLWIQPILTILVSIAISYIFNFVFTKSFRKANCSNE